MLQARLKPTYTPWIHYATSNAAGIFAHFLTNSVMFASQTTFTNSVGTWILDFGATHHITPYLHLLSNYKNVMSELYLPNVDICQIPHIDNVTLSPELILTDVLVVLIFNGIFYQLLKNSCDVLFSSNKCVLQASAMKRGNRSVVCQKVYTNSFLIQFILQSCIQVLLQT